MRRFDRPPTRDPKVGVVMGLVMLGVAAGLLWGFVRAADGRGGLVVNGGWVLLACTIITLVLGARTLIVSVMQVRDENATRLPWRFDEFTTTRFPRLGIVLSLAVIGLSGALLWGFVTLGDGFLLFCATAVFALGTLSMGISVNTLRRGRSPSPPT
jgi:hypothetical protein